MTSKLDKQLIDSRRLLYFYHVSKSGSFSKAEGAVYMPQPVISRQISKLEEQLGVQLLERNGRGVTLTRFGEILLPNAEKILTLMADSIHDIDQAIRRPIGHVRIGGSATIMSLYMPAIVNRFMAELPHVELTAVQASTGEVYNQLVEGNIDIGIVLEVPNRSKFAMLELSSDRMMLLVARNHDLGKLNAISPRAASEAQLALPASSHGLRSVIDRYFAENGFSVQPHLQIDSIPLLRAVIADGKLATILPQSTCRMEFDPAEYSTIPLTPELNRSLYAAYPHQGTRSPFVAALLRHVTNVFGAKPSLARDDVVVSEATDPSTFPDNAEVLQPGAASVTPARSHRKRLSAKVKRTRSL